MTVYPVAAIRARALKAHAWNAKLRRTNADVTALADGVAALCDALARAELDVDNANAAANTNGLVADKETARADTAEDEVKRLRVATNALVFVGERMAILLSKQESDAGDAAVRDWRVEVEALAALKGTR